MRKFIRENKFVFLLKALIILFPILLLTECKYSKVQNENHSFVDTLNNDISLANKRSFNYMIDSSGEVTLKVVLSYKNDLFELFLIGKANPKRESWDSTFIVNDIRLYKNGRDSLRQIKIQTKADLSSKDLDMESLEVVNYKNLAISDFVEDKINFVDYNFDNYPDLSIYNRDLSSTGGDIYYTWISDHGNDYYKFSELLSSANIGKLDTTNRTISMWWKTGVCDNDTWLYKFQGDSFKLIKKVTNYSIIDSLGEMDCKEKIQTY